jgi:DNA-binding NarL/FixJ family response regulator
MITLDDSSDAQGNGVGFATGPGHPHLAERRGDGHRPAQAPPSTGTVSRTGSKPRTNESIRVLLADDHAVVRDGLLALLQREGFTIVGAASDGLEAVEHARESQPSIAVLDFDMPQMNGIIASQQIARVAPRTRLVLLTMYRDRQHVLAAMRAGIHAFVIKSQAASDLVQAIRVVTAGELYLSPVVSATVVDAFNHPAEDAAPTLTAREQQMLQLVAEGKSTKEAANALAISVKTAESHRTRLMAKIDVHDTASLVRYAIREGFIKP